MITETMPIVPDQSWAAHRLFLRRPWLGALPPTPDLPCGAELRPIHPAETGALATLLSRAFDDARDEVWVRTYLTAALDVDTIYVVAQGGRLLATASARLLPTRFPSSGYVHWVGVDPDARGQQLGMAVVLAVLERFRSLQMRDAVLETHDFRRAAIRLYLRLGFVPDYIYGDADERFRWADVFAALCR